MKRFAMQKLLDWKNDPGRLPLIIRGARQVGKTWLMKEFGKCCFEKCAYISFDRNRRMEQLFSGDFNVDRILTGLSIESGVDTVQSTLGGLGGCPFAPGASGNTATEDLVYMLQRMGYDTGIDFDKLLALSRYQHERVQGIYSGHQININAKNNCCL